MKNIKKEYYFISILLIIFILLTLFVVKGTFDSIDEFIFNNVIKLKSESITFFLRIITHLASTVSVIILLFITALIFIRRKIFSDFKYVITNVGLGVLIMKVLKHIIKRVRPSWKWIVQGGFSYPSGHTISALLFYGTLCLLINKKLVGTKRKVLMTFCIIMIILTGISRIYFGAHYLSDVIASTLIGSIILIISNIFMNKEFNNDKDKNRKTI